MKRSARYAAPLRRARVLLALTVLLGLLGMHGLAAGTAAPVSLVAPMGHLAPQTGDADHDQAADDCPDCHGGGHHGQVHAGPMCLSAAPAAPYVPPAPSPAPTPSPATRWPAPIGVVLDDQAGGRAPPDLAELQLLRI